MIQILLTFKLASDMLWHSPSSNACEEPRPSFVTLKTQTLPCPPAAAVRFRGLMPSAVVSSGHLCQQTEAQEGDIKALHLDLVRQRPRLVTGPIFG